MIRSLIVVYTSTFVIWGLWRLQRLAVAAYDWAYWNEERIVGWSLPHLDRVERGRERVR